MPPGDLVDGDAEYGGDFLALGGARRPAAQGDRGDAAVVEAGALGELGHVDVLFATEIGDGAGHENGDAGYGMRDTGEEPIRATDKGLRRFLGACLHRLLASALKLYRILTASIISIDEI